MGLTAWIVTGAVVLVVALVAVSMAVGGHRRRQVRELFGPDDVSAGEVQLRHHGADSGGGAGAGAGAGAASWADGGDEAGLRPLDADVVERYRRDWNRVQTGFVDRPALALHEADTLVTAALAEVGHPVEGLEQLGGTGPTGPTSPTPPSVTLERYRAVQRVNLRADSSETTTDELRQAFVQYRHLLDDLLRSPAAAAAGDLDGSGHPVRSG